MKVTGSNITITDSVVNKMDILPLGNCEQDTYTGKNLLNSKGGFDRGYISSTGAFVSEDYTAVFQQYISTEANMNLTLSSKYILRSIAFIYYDNNKDFISREANTSNVSSFSVITPTNTKYVKIQVSYRVELITQEIINTLDLQVENGSSATDYEPYVRWNTKS